MNVIHIKDAQVFEHRMKRAEQLNASIAALTDKGGRGELTRSDWIVLQQEREYLNDVCAEIGKMVAQWYIEQKDDEPSALDELLHEPQRDDTLDDRHWAIGAGGR